MWLFDIGAILYFVGFFNMVWFLIKRDRNTALVCVILEIIGGLVMWIAYYLVAGNPFAFEKMLS